MSVISAQKFSKYATHESPDEDMVVTSRPSATSILAIDSADRYNTFVSEFGNTTSAYSFTITRNQSIFNGFFKRIALTEIVFPYAIPNINSYTNQLYYKKNGGATASITLPKGFYTPSALATAVETLLQAGGFASATVTYVTTPGPQIAGSFYIETNTADTIQFLRGNSTSLINSDTSINTVQLFDMMALDDTDAVDVGGYRIASCRPIEYVDVICSQLTYNQELKDASTALLFRDVLARIYIETETSPAVVYSGGVPVDTIESIPGTFPFTIYRQFRTPKQIKWDNAMPIGSLKFELFDNYGNPLNSGLAPFSRDLNNADVPDWKMTLLISEN